MAAHFDEKTGLMSHITLLKDNTDIEVTNNFYYYKGDSGTGNSAYQASGAYIFRPLGAAIEVSATVTSVTVSVSWIF